MADVSKIKLPSGVTYDIKDDGALPLTGGTVTGPVIFQDTTSMDEATIGDLVVNGNASFTNNINANTINSAVVGNSPKFTDEKLAISDINVNNTYYPILATDSTAAAARQYDNIGLEYRAFNGTAGDASSDGLARLTLGNNKTHSTAKWKQGILRLYGIGAYYVDLKGSPTANRTITIPNATGTLALTSDIPSSATSSTTGISISNHSTGSVTGVQSSTTTASKVTLGTAISVPNVTSVGSASTWTFEEKTIPNVTAAGSGSFTQGSFSGGSLTFAIDSTDNKRLNITFTAATHGADSHTHTAPTLGTAKSIPNVTGVSDVTVPIKNTSATTVVTSATHTVTDNGHTHSLS